MIPSDHFVYLYNEIFKFLQKRDGLERYYARVADRQSFFTLEAFRRDGLQGMYDYWERIRVEENCDSWNEVDLEKGYYQSRQNKCPSLTKALDSDAGPCAVYCDHCPGWVLKVMTAAGFYCVFNLKSRTVAQCAKFCTKDRALAEAKKAEWIAEWGAELIRDNFKEMDKANA